MSNKKNIKIETEFAGRKLVLETGEFAMQANMAVKASYGDSVVLATAVSSGPNPDLDYFPLSVNYFERMFASGTIKSSRFMKRDGRPTDEATITRRLIDHAIRPLFPQDEGFMDEVQVAVSILSFDEDADPVFLSMVAVSAALHASDIPWRGPMSSVRVGYLDDKYLLNPSIEVLKNESSMDMVVSFVGPKKRFLALEAESNLLAEEIMLGGIKFAMENVDPVLNLIVDFAEKVNPGNKKYEFESKLPPSDVIKDVSELVKSKVVKLIGSGKDKVEMVETEEELMKEIYTTFGGKYKKVDMEKAFSLLEKEALQHLILEEGKRTDGRATDELREISGSVGVLPRVHGSAVFTRGMTQVMNVATLGSPSMEQLIQDMYGERTKRFIHFYSFPPFSTGEVGRMGFPGGREIGHSILTERALTPVIPSQKEFPYTIVLQSDTLSSNGSSSMAAACAGSMALMDAGVPIKGIVAGVGIGLITNEDFSNYKLLTDLTGIEDGSGFMDFKMTGTKDGISAIQVDIKAKGLGFDMLPEVFEKSREARLKIIEEMEKVIPSPREQVSEYAPKTMTHTINPDQIGLVIGSGGRTIKQIQEDTGTTISIEADGLVTISGEDEENVARAQEVVKAITRKVKAGEIFDGKVEEIAPYGAFVEILPGKTGLLHISELTSGYVENVEDVIKEGDTVKVKVIEVSRDGKYSLSMKALEAGEDKSRQRGRGGRKPDHKKQDRR